MVKKLKKIDISGIGEMLLIDLSKAFDCFRHELLTGKLAVYGFDWLSLCFIHSYLSGRTQRAKVNHTYSSYAGIKYGVSQGFLLGSGFFSFQYFRFTFRTMNVASYKLANSTQDLFRSFSPLVPGVH